jgi:hypothetical protein
MTGTYYIVGIAITAIAEKNERQIEQPGYEKNDPGRISSIFR